MPCTSAAGVAIDTNPVNLLTPTYSFPLTLFLRSFRLERRHLFGSECNFLLLRYCCAFPLTIELVITENIQKYTQIIPTGYTGSAILLSLLLAIPWLDTGAHVSCWFRGFRCGCSNHASGYFNQDIYPLLVVSFILNTSFLYLIILSVLIQLFERAYASPATDGDFFACLTISWFLFAITVEQSIMRSTFSHWTAHGFTLFSLWWLTKCMIGSELRLDKKISFDGERAPLIA